MKDDKLPRVAVLVDTATGWGRRIIHGVIRYSDKHGPWRLSIQARCQRDCVTPLRNWRGDGIIAWISSESNLRALQAAGLPTVNVSAIDLPDNDFPQVTTDYRESAKLAVAHF